MLSNLPSRMGEDIVNLVNQLALEARPKILALCTLTWEERERVLKEEREKIECEEEIRSSWSIDGALDIDNVRKLGCSVAKILLEQGNPSVAKELYARYDHYLEAAKAAKKQGMLEEARNYAREAIKTERFWFHQQFLEVADFFSEKEIEKEMQPLLEKYKDHDEKRTLVEAVIAKKLGQKEKLENLYKESKKRLNKAYKSSEKYYGSKNKEANYEALENASYVTVSLSENLAELCIIISRYEEAVDLLADNINRQWVLEEPLASVLDKKEEMDKRLIYDMLLNDAITNTSPKNFLMGAKVAEKLGSKKDAEKYYKEAINQKEEMLYLGTAFEIAKKLKLEEKLKTYTAIAAYLYEHKNI